MDRSLLEAALYGYTVELERVHEKISAIVKELGGRSIKPAAVADAGEAKPKRKMMSASARSRIAEAQKKRWAEYHAQKQG